MKKRLIPDPHEMRAKWRGRFHVHAQTVGRMRHSKMIGGGLANKIAGAGGEALREADENEEPWAPDRIKAGAKIVNMRKALRAE